MDKISPLHITTMTGSCILNTLTSNLVINEADIAQEEHPTAGNWTYFSLVTYLKNC